MHENLIRCRKTAFPVEIRLLLQCIHNPLIRQRKHWRAGISNIPTPDAGNVHLMQV